MKTMKIFLYNVININLSLLSLEVDSLDVHSFRKYSLLIVQESMLHATYSLKLFLKGLHAVPQLVQCSAPTIYSSN